MRANLEPVTLQAKEGLAMTNGTTVSAATAALAIHDVDGLAVMAQVLTATTVEALTGTKESFHPFLSEIEFARNILAFLEGSTLAKVNDGTDSSLRQDRYSIRTALQWLGPILEDFVLSHQQISVECNSATDNPLVTPDGEFLHGGNFQAKSVTSAMEKVRQGVQGIGRMIFSQCTKMINPATNRGLPPNLLAEDPSIALIFKGTDLNIAALTSELGFLANPVNHVQTAEMGNQSLNSLALIPARYTHAANDVLSQMMAAHLIAVCQALDLRAMYVQFLDAYRLEFSDVISKIFHDKHKISNALSVLLWSQLLKAFDTTASMDAEDRFIAIAKSLRTVLLDHADLYAEPDLVTSLQDFTGALSQSMKDSWRWNPELEHMELKLRVWDLSLEVYRALRDGTLSKIAVDLLAA
ncbi:phenylalanine ammonia-lyase, partial [Aureobasidium melanogenum]